MSRHIGVAKSETLSNEYYHHPRVPHVWSLRLRVGPFRFQCSWKLHPAQVDSSGPGRTAARDPHSRQLSALTCATAFKHRSDSSQFASNINKLLRIDFVLETMISLQRLPKEAKSELGLSNHHCSSRQKAHLKKFNHVICVLHRVAPQKRGYFSNHSLHHNSLHMPERVSDIQGRFGSCISSQARQRAKALGGHCECLRNKPRILSSPTSISGIT